MHAHIHRKLAERLLGHDPLRLIAEIKKSVRFATINEGCRPRGQRKHKVEGMADLPCQRYSLVEPFNRAVRIPPNPLRKTPRPMLGEDQRIVVGQRRDPRVPLGNVDLSQMIRVAEGMLIIGFPEVLAARRHVVDHRQVCFTVFSRDGSQLAEPFVRPREICPGLVVNPETPKN